MCTMPGRSVRLFLVDGTPQGIRTAEVGNWTGLALVSPRTDLARLNVRREIHRTGVYILVGPSEASASGLAVYVGEGDEVWARLVTHDGTKEFWTWVAVFVSKDDNLTKAHVRWLEAALVKEIRAAKRAEVTNANEPGGGGLPEADTADMETFLENVRLLLPTLGVNVFAGSETAKTEAPAGPVLDLRWEDARAECFVRDGQFVVREGSTARVVEVDSLGAWVRTLRSQLKENGVLVAETRGLLRFSQDYAFDSPSAAAGVVTGTGLNGRAHWRERTTGLSYKEWLEKQVGATAPDPEP